MDEQKEELKAGVWSRIGFILLSYTLLPVTALGFIVGFVAIAAHAGWLHAMNYFDFHLRVIAADALDGKEKTDDPTARP